MSAASFWVASNLTAKASSAVSEEPPRCVGPLTVERPLDFDTRAFRASLVPLFLPAVEPGRFFGRALLLLERDFFRLAIGSLPFRVLQCQCGVVLPSGKGALIRDALPLSRDEKRTRPPCR